MAWRLTSQEIGFRLASLRAIAQQDEEYPYSGPLGTMLLVGNFNGNFERVMENIRRRMARLQADPASSGETASEEV